MKILVTGTPGTGKTSIGKALANKNKALFLNESEFALREGIAEFNLQENELELPLKKMQQELNKFIKKNNKKNIVIEGHTLCETRLKVDKVIVLKVDPEMLEDRLLVKNYSPAKVLDNVFCEGIDYVLKHAKRNYKNKVIIIKNESSINDTVKKIMNELKK